MQDITKLTVEQLEAEAQRCADSADESYKRSGEDGCVSQFCSDLNARLYSRQARILKDGGAEFRGLFRKADGKRIRAKRINGAYGWCWALCDAAGQFTGKFIPSAKTKVGADDKFVLVPSKKMAALGLEERYELAPAKAEIQGSGTGLSGLATCGVGIVRLDRGFPADAVEL